MKRAISSIIIIILLILMIFLSATIIYSQYTTVYKVLKERTHKEILKQIPDIILSEIYVKKINTGASTYTAIRIHNPNSYDLTDYQVKIEIDVTEPFAVVDENENILPYCFEQPNGECNSTLSDVIWVKVPYIPANGNITLYLIPSDTNHAVNGDQVFDLYDDFNSEDTSKWVYTTGHNYGFGNDGAGYGYGIWFNGDANGDVATRTKKTFSRNIIIESLWNKNERCADHFIYISKSSSATWRWGSMSGVIRFVWNCDYKKIYGQSSASSSIRGAETIYFIRIIIKDNQVIFYDHYANDPTNSNTLILNDNIGDGFYIYIGADQDYTNYKSYMYWIKVRKYADQEVEVEYVKSESNLTLYVYLSNPSSTPLDLDRKTVSINECVFKLKYKENFDTLSGSSILEPGKSDVLEIFVPKECMNYLKDENEFCLYYHGVKRCKGFAV